MPNFFTLNELVLLCALAGFVYKFHLNNYRILSISANFWCFEVEQITSTGKKILNFKMELDLYVNVV